MHPGYLLWNAFIACHINTNLNNNIMKQLTEKELKQNRTAIIVTLIVMIPLGLVSAFGLLYWLFYHFQNMH